MVGRVFLVAKRCAAGDILSAFLACPKGTLDFSGSVFGVHFIDDVSERGNIHLGLLVGIITIIDCNIADTVFRKEDFHIRSGFDVVASKSGLVFGNDCCHLSFPDIIQKFLKGRTVRVRTAVTIINIVLAIPETVACGILHKHRLLSADAQAFAV